MFSNADVFQYSKVWVIPKDPAARPPASNPITWTEFRDPPGSDFNMQPAHTFGTPAAEYFLFEGSTNRLARGLDGQHSPAPRSGTPRCRSR